MDALGGALMNSEFMLKKKITTMLDNGADGESYTQICDIFRRLGVGAVLMDLDVDSFDNYLYCSGKTYIEQLQHCKSDSIDTYYSWLSHASPLINALAIRADDVSSSIAKMANRECLTLQGEDAEQCYFFRCLVEMIETSDIDNENSEIFPLYADANGGDCPESLAVIEAMYLKDQTLFDESIVEYIDAWHTTMDEGLVEKLVEPYDIPVIPFICLEALALINLAQARGLRVEADYPYIPAEIMKIRSSRFPADFSILPI